MVENIDEHQAYCYGLRFHRELQACAVASNICDNEGLRLRTEIYKQHFTPDDDLDITQTAMDV